MARHHINVQIAVVAAYYFVLLLAVPFAVAFCFFIFTDFGVAAGYASISAAIAASMIVPGIFSIVVVAVATAFFVAGARVRTLVRYRFTSGNIIFVFGTAGLTLNIIVGGIFSAILISAPDAHASFQYYYVTFLVALLFALPLVNAGLDWASLSATRNLLGRWLAPRAGTSVSKLHIALLNLADIGVALAALFGLAAALAVAFALSDRLFAAANLPPLTWWQEAKAARADPFGDGLPLTLMLLSTLLPTFLHLLAGSFALLLAPVPWAARHVEAALTYRIDGKFPLGPKLALVFGLSLYLTVLLGILGFVLFRILVWVIALAAPGELTLPDLLFGFAALVRDLLSGG